MAQEKTIAAQKTPDLFKRRPGRPKLEAAMTNAERQAKYRTTHKAVQIGASMVATVESLAADFDMSQAEVTRELIRWALTNRNWRQTGF